MSQTITIEKQDSQEEKNHVFYDTHGWMLFVFIVVLYTVLSIISDQYVFNEEFYYRSFSKQLSLRNIEAFLSFRDNYQWAGYVFLPVILLFKMCFVAICISIGMALSNIEFEFKTIFKATFVAEIVFIIAQTWYIANLYLNLSTLTLETTSNYYPLSAISYFGVENVVTWLHYPLQTLNLFEAFYITAISWLLSKQWKPDFVESLSIVLPSYATGLILWLALVTFLTIQVS